jgi:hypothetical protein
MESIWRKHLIICLFLGLLAIPVYFLDLALNKPERASGNWITPNFQGFILWTYIALLAIQVVLSSIAILSFPTLGALPIHFGSMLLSLILLVAGFFIFVKAA